ncbi:MAG: potassium-transporting ATPase subunit KdpC [Gemmatimonadales bacterium]
MRKELRPTLVLFLLLSLLTGAMYPLAVTGIARVAFPGAAAGSFISHNGVVVGSRLIGQSFAGAEWFHGRPSATGGGGYNAASSSGSNLGPINPGLLDSLAARATTLRRENALGAGALPVDLLTASASGLDPHITPAAARLQIHRVAVRRGVSDAIITDLVAKHTEARQLGVLGEPRVNVLRLNIALAELSARGHL